MMAHGDTKSHHVRSSSGGRSRSRSRGHKYVLKSHPMHSTPLSTAEQDALNLKYQQMKLERQQAEVEQVELLQSNSVRLTGYLQSEIATALKTRERYGLADGDFLDDPVSAAQGKPGFGEEYAEHQGIRLLVNICLDCSNSMTHNNVENASLAAAYTLYAMIDNIVPHLPEGTITVEIWKWAKGRGGDGVYRVKPDYTDNDKLSPQQRMVQTIQRINMDGEDTYIAPLFRELYEYEVVHGWAGEARLDIVLTDGVLEHKKDRKDASEYQLRRNGGLNTVLLNFLPMQEWADVHLPDHCFQYEATADNVFTMMSKVFGEWIMSV